MARVAREKTSEERSEKYRKMLEWQKERARAESAAGREIGDIPAIVNKDRRKKCERDFKAFCEEYFPATFPLAWSDAHLACISKMEKSILSGGLFSLALPRGAGKTTLSEIAVIWAMLYGHRKFAVLIGATEEASGELLSDVKIHLETNDELLADFPEALFPVRKLEGINARCRGQTCMGERTRIVWGAGEIHLPTLKDSPSSGAVLRTAGITGRIRGMRAQLADGSGSIRPDIVIIDDPQTRESACSLAQTKSRVATVSGDILGLAGPGKTIAAVMPVTIIRPHDLADQLCDPERHPEWRGERHRLLPKMPSNMPLWQEYAEVLADSLRDYGDNRKGNEFYLEHRSELEDGAVVGWEARKSPDEVSALQSAMNLYFRDVQSFMAEYQNEPDTDSDKDDDVLDPVTIAEKQLSGLERGTAPLWAEHLVAFIDVQKPCFFWLVCAFADDHSGTVIDYGAFPEQRARRFTLGNLTPSLQDVYKGKPLEAQLTDGLDDLLKMLENRQYKREDGELMSFERIAIDANWGTSTEVVYSVCRRHHPLCIPSHGRYVGAASRPMSEYKKNPGDRVGLNWRLQGGRKKTQRHMIFDANWWKSFLCDRLTLPYGATGAITLFGSNPTTHELIAEHLTSEFRIKTTGWGRQVDEWRLLPARSDNHWLDCLVGCCVLASICGCALEGYGMPLERRARTVKDASSELSSPVETAEKPVEKRRLKLSSLKK